MHAPERQDLPPLTMNRPDAIPGRAGTPPIRAVIWDLGGVLVRTEDHTPRAQWASRLGMDPRELSRRVFDTPAGHAAALGTIDTQALLRSIGESLSLSAPEVEKFRDDFFSGDRVDVDLIEAIRRLRPRRRTALLSNAWSDLRKWVEDEWKIGDAFDEILISAEEGVAKPDPEIFLRALRRLGVPSPQAVMIDDMDRNLEAARALGMQTVRFADRNQCAAELSLLLQEPFELTASARGGRP